MFTRQNYRLDRTQPALIVQHGHTAKKYFYLNERGMTLGCARGCDIELAADGISAVHCIITRSSTGVYVRDCASRLGTKVNGTKVSEAPLHNGDVLQIGLFVFEVSLPPAPNVEDTPVDNSNVYHERIEALQKSRERLVLLAWHLRRRLLDRRVMERRANRETPAAPVRPQALCELNLDEEEALALLPRP